MSHPHFHSKSSSRRFGGIPSDYYALHEWFDQVKAHLPDVRHRAVLHSSFGIYLAQQVFGEVLVRKSDGGEVPPRLLGEQQVLEDRGYIPTVQEWLKELPLRAWMVRGAKRLVSDDPRGTPKKSARSGKPKRTASAKRPTARDRKP